MGSLKNESIYESPKSVVESNIEGIKLFDRRLVLLYIIINTSYQGLMFKLPHIYIYRNIYRAILARDNNDIIVRTLFIIIKYNITI